MASYVADERVRMAAMVVTAPETLAGVPLTDDEARELSRAAKQATSWTERRNALIREYAERGRGVREIARATGLSPASVHNILYGRKR